MKLLSLSCPINNVYHIFMIESNIWGNVIGNSSEKTDLCIAKSKYPNIIILCYVLRVQVKRETILYHWRKRKMKFKSSKRITSWLLRMMLIVAVAFTTVGCQPSAIHTGAGFDGKREECSWRRSN